MRAFDHLGSLPQGRGQPSRLIRYIYRRPLFSPSRQELPCGSEPARRTACQLLSRSLSIVNPGIEQTSSGSVLPPSFTPDSSLRSHRVPRRSVSRHCYENEPKPRSYCSQRRSENRCRVPGGSRRTRPTISPQRELRSPPAGYQMAVGPLISVLP